MIMEKPSQNSQQNPQQNSHGRVEEIFTDFFCRVGRVKNCRGERAGAPQRKTRSIRTDFSEFSFQSRLTGRFQTEGLPDLDSSIPIGPFFVHLGTFPFFWGGVRIFPICPFPLSQPISRKPFFSVSGSRGEVSRGNGTFHKRIRPEFCCEIRKELCNGTHAIFSTD